MNDAAHNPATIPAPGSYHRTPRLQRDFLEAFATNGSVKISAAKVGMSPSAVYQLKQRPEGAAFKLGCAAALLIARGRLVDELLDRAIWGHDETAEIQREEGRSFVKRRRLDSRLGLAMLARLDKMVETRASQKGGWLGEEMFAQIIAGDWPGFLALFDAAEAVAPGAAGAENTDAEGQWDGMAAALALWLAARGNRANPLATLWRGTAIANEVAQISAISDAGPESADEEGPAPEEEAAAMTVWHDEETGELRTNFPPPGGFIGIEEGAFGDEDYARTLDADEEEAWEAAHAELVEPLRRAGEAARRAFFGLPAPANDPAPASEKLRKSASG
ncbi:hypothetical protein ATE68_02140 [Sphingopyxis sp. H038]|uniref:hypothetical protein n=1 Tax=unclassified Sphingopyxis TaxID=2614943 RepID=UPI000730DF2F|nr:MULTISPECIES: hypothetical protein [unclassified Sphingopyxis]KTE04466.1 hypothetical protein ATE78_02140 [Sphingopyxis sp. H012]KTE13334.1 hypothetical protein ATE70_01285 [Sphingopyxis sp. H053]KTE14521.1 hypothetical protein ATE76_08845 [Sphingopyxis sp. H093]KTE31173.1 hypothetical protein ATE75_01260 [Sphingopyxis sp. H080]KTE36956.1 hypothetical protein ATE68_02140 [Sphingopyxis sp. H038]